MKNSHIERHFSETELRLQAMLASALGDAARQYLSDDSIIEVMLNPDGKIWIDRLGEGQSFTGFSMSAVQAEKLIYTIAGGIGASCSKECPILSAELPGSGSRFQGLLPPIVSAPTFAIRKKAIRIFSLSDYVTNTVLSASQAAAIREMVLEKKNILIVGGTGSGKTTLANALLAEIANTGDRIVVLEDTTELQCAAENRVAIRTVDGVVSLTDALKATLRLRPDRIIVGEVRGREALDLLKAWNTGHPGGCATVHADSAAKGLFRLEQLIQEAGVPPSKELIAEAVNVVVFIEKTPSGRKVSEIVRVSWDGERRDYRFVAI